MTSDLVSVCCQAKFRWYRTAAGYRPQCKKCDTLCDVAQPQAIIEKTPPLDFSETEDEQQ